MTKVTGGVLSPLFTAFDSDGRLALPAMKALVEDQVRGGVDGVWIGGMTGEAFSLSPKERREIIPAAVAGKGSAYLMVSVSGFTLNECLEFSRYAEGAGVDCLSVLPPPVIKFSEDELFNFYSAVSAAVSIPITVYLNEWYTGVKFSPAFLARLSNELPNFIGVEDSSGDLTVLSDYKRLCPPKFISWNGWDKLGFAALMLGVKGLMGAIVPVAPALVVGMYKSVKSGDYEAARAYQDRINILARAMVIGSPAHAIATCKTMMNLLGLNIGPCRPPVEMPNAKVREQLQQALIEAGIARRNL